MENTKKPDYNVGEYVVIYIYSLPYVSTHVGHLKIGKTSIKFLDYNLAQDKQDAINKAANKRISDDLKTPEVNYDLEYCTLAITNDGKSFMDHDVHNVLKRSNISNIIHIKDKTYGEWYETTLGTAIKAIEAVKHGRLSLSASDIIEDDNTFMPRKGSQTVAIEKTLKAIRNGKKHFLWDAKMRFGKTLTALEVAKQMKYSKVLIITHRPEVADDWFKDFNFLFNGTDYRFGSRDKGENIKTLQNNYLRGGNNTIANPFIYFSSVQYLRHEVKNSEKLAILRESWDMLIIDEADEGIKTTLANETIMPIKRDFTLMLSGTPFNLLEDYTDDEIYSWDYTSEQELKTKWDELYPDEPNPYYKLPRLSIYTYYLDKYLNTEEFDDLYTKAFNFKEFFRTNENGYFVHEKHIKKFLDLISTESESNFPFSRENFRSQLRHTLWILPGVKEARALEKLLNDHPIFRSFNIANVAGDGNEEVSERKSRKIVEKAITNNPLNSYSITISCGKMTRGVSVPEWSAVFMLANTSSASTYLQTIFRAQTPWEYRGILKTDCFVFDFAPDRTLNVVAEVMKIKKKSPTTDEIKEATSKFLNYCSVISATGGEMKPFSTYKLMQAIKKVTIQRVTRNGFDDPRLYNFEKLEHCSDDELADFAELNEILGQSHGEKDNNKVRTANNGFNEEEYEKVEAAEKKKREKRQLTPEEEEYLRRKREIAEQRKIRISILRGISIRLPMLIFGCKIDQNGKEIKAEEEITLNQFIDNVDDESWLEFMPSGVTKELLRDKFSKYYDDEVFVGAGIDIRLRALAADNLAPSERVTEISELFKSFRNPDKETVLTPWKVVNIHLNNIFGGADFNEIIEFRNEVTNESDKLGLPNWVNKGELTEIWSNREARILEINSKSGLYPLLASYNFYISALPKIIKDETSTEEDVFRGIWNEILEKNIFVLCKSPMAKTITERTLAGYTNAKTNVVYIRDLVSKLKQKEYDLASVLLKSFNKGENKMLKFDAIIGNPPYNYETGRRKIPIYQYFIMASKDIGNIASFITPDGFVKGGQQLEPLREWIQKNKNLKYVEFHKEQLFPTAAVDAAITLFDFKSEFEMPVKKIYDQEGLVYDGFLDWQYRDVVVEEKKYEILNTFERIKKNFDSDMSMIIPGRAPFGLNTKCYKENKNKFSLEATKDKKIKILVGEDGNDFYYINPKDDFSYKDSDGRIEIVKLNNSDRWKMVFPKAGKINDRLLKTRILNPGTIFTDKYLCIFTNTKDEALNVEKYFNTKFYRAGLGSKMTSWILYRKWHSNIPQQDFTNNSDINWNSNLSEIDKQLFEKYKLSNEEIRTIEEYIKV